MLRKREKGFTLIELLIVIAIIGILAAIAIPMYRAQTVKAKLSEVTNSMSNVSSGVAAYYSDNGQWPPALTGKLQIKNTLGVDVPEGAKYILSAATAAGGVINFVITGTGETLVDGKTLTMTPNTLSGGINWLWTATAGFPDTYKPKK